MGFSINMANERLEVLKEKIQKTTALLQLDKLQSKKIQLEEQMNAPDFLV